MGCAHSLAWWLGLRVEIQFALMQMRRGCNVCGSVTRSLLCVSCLNALHLNEQLQLKWLFRKRDSLLSTIHDQFTSKVRTSAQVHASSSWNVVLLQRVAREQERERQERTLHVEEASTSASALQRQLEEGARRAYYKHPHDAHTHVSMQRKRGWPS